MKKSNNSFIFLQTNHFKTAKSLVNLKENRYSPPEKLMGIYLEKNMDNKDCGTEALYNNVDRKTGIAVSLMLILSLLFNITALLTPFYTAKMFMKSPYTCTLPGSVLLMWNHQLLLIALLIFAFSIVFPFFKLSILFYTWFICRNKEKSEHFITIIGPLGKWSMLDIFMTIILLVMTNDQFLITSTLKIGVYFFLAAIFLSMTCALKMEILIFNNSIKSLADRLSFIQNFWKNSLSRRLSIFLLLIVTLTTLILAISAPIVQINDFFFVGNEYSIFTSITTLWNSSILLTFFAGFTLIISPCLHIMGLFLLWTVEMKPRYSHMIERLVHAISIFNMMDVFCLALLIFMTSGSELIATKEKSGIYVLLIFILCVYLIPVFINGTHKNYLQFIKKIASQTHLPQIWPEN